MFNFSVPEGLLGACEPKEAYVSFFLLQDSADPMARAQSVGGGSGPEDTRAILGWLVLGRALRNK